MIKVIVLSPHTLSIASIIIQKERACAWPGQTTAGNRVVVKIYRKVALKNILCKILNIPERPSTTFLNYQESEKVSSHAADIITYTLDIFQILSHLSGALSRNTCYSTSSKTAIPRSRTRDLKASRAGLSGPGQDNASYLSGIMAATEGRPRQLDNVLKLSRDPIWRILQSLMCAYLKRVLLSLGAG